MTGLSPHKVGFPPYDLDKLIKDAIAFLKSIGRPTDSLTVYKTVPFMRRMQLRSYQEKAAAGSESPRLEDSCLEKEKK